MTKDNIILIGMPTSGKSTMGVRLSRLLKRPFVDTDNVIKEKFGDGLSGIIAEKGIDGFLELENQVCADFTAQRTVIATGGSVVYGTEAMENLRSIGTVVYLQLPYTTIRRRLRDPISRGVTLRPGQTILDLYRERIPLYEKWADVTLDCTGKRAEVMERMLNELVLAGIITQEEKDAIPCRKHTHACKTKDKKAGRSIKKTKKSKPQKVKQESREN